ncbi:sigma-54-dependent Fis family transcriptional regulator [Candidatus Poribacteria bacterium]|jgi:DNA-binding NtrC family response regulator|nr:sigma-54-dependent Fis family transcriptional regulator [Candidatus Poribacteria bacterium]MDP6747470.1 sigma-54 dependent transcriptional regulator [Candidatus Poribacteria bacterium]
MKIQLLVVDDDEPFRHVLLKELSRRGFTVDGAADGKQALKYIEKDACHVVLLDMRMPEMDGLTVLTQIKQISPSTEVIMLTAYADLNDAVEATKRGAFHYLMKPAQLAEVEILIRRAHEKSILEAQNLALREQLERGQTVTELVGESPSMKETQEIIRKVSPTDATVLILGESGVGKEVVAHEIHAKSLRSHKPLVVVDCTVLQENLVESELFGHERGSYTGATSQKRGLLEAAREGTLFVDEVGDASLTLQAKLLRVLETGEFRRVGGTHTLTTDVRIIAASNQNLLELIEQGRFRADLYHRLNIVDILVPPLRERRDEIPLLAYYFLDQTSRRTRKTIELSSEALDILTAYDWPGNVRELKNVLERVVILVDGNTIEPTNLPNSIIQTSKATFDTQRLMSLQQMETEYIEWVLGQVDGKRKSAAEILRIDPKTLYRKLKPS